MALEFAHGSFDWLSTDTVGTTKTLTCGFEAKAIRIYFMGLQSSTDATSQATSERRCVGFGANTTSRRCVGTFGADAAAAMDTDSIARNDAIGVMTDGAGATTALLDISAISSTAVTLVVDDQAPTSLTVFWEAWGGSDITNVTIGDIAEPAATGTQNYTATGFVTSSGVPDQMVFLAGVQSTAAVNTGAISDSGLYIGSGHGTASSDQWVIVGNNDEGSAAADTDGYARAGEILAMITVAGGNPSSRAALSAFGTDLFTLNWTNRATTSRRSIYMAIKGGRWDAGSYTIAGNSLNANTTVSGLSFQPKGILFAGAMKIEATAGTATAEDRMSFGTASSTSSRRSQGIWDENGTANQEINHTIDYDSVLSFPSSAGALAAAYDLDAINSDGFRVIVDVAGGVASEWQGFVTFGDIPPPLTANLSVTEATDTLSALALGKVSENRILLSENLNDSRWVKTGTTVTADATADPDANVTADLVTETSGGTTHNFRVGDGSTAGTGVKISSGLYYTYSIFAKANGRDRLIVSHSSGVSVEFNIGTQTVGTALGILAGTALIEDYGSGWYRCSYTFLAANSEIWPMIQLLDASGNQNYSGDGTSGIYFWGAMLNQGTLATYVSTKPVATNLIDRSHEFDNAYYTLSEATTVTGNSDPNSGTEADSLRENTVNAQHYIEFTSTESVSENTVYTWSGYVKNDGRDAILIRFFDQASSVIVECVFTITGGVFSSVADGNGQILGYGSESAGASFTRVWVSFKTGTGTTGTKGRWNLWNGSTSTYAGLTINGVFLWGWQLQAGSVGTYVTMPAQAVATSSTTDAADTLTSAAAVSVVSTASLTEATDTLTSASVVSVVSTASLTEATDTLTSASVVSVVATSSTTDDADTLSSTATVADAARTATLSVTEDTDTLTSAAVVSVAATSSMTEATDTLTSASVVSVVATASLTEETDTLTSASVVSVVATASLTEATDTLTSQANRSTDATASLTEDTDTLSSASVVSVVSSLSATEDTDTLSSASVVSVISSLSATEDPDTLSSQANRSTDATASLTEDTDALSSDTDVSVVATLSATEDTDTLSSTATALGSAEATLSATEDTDTLTSAAVVSVVATSSTTDAADTLTSAAVVSVVATASLTEATDTLTSASVVSVIATASLTEATDTLTSAAVAPKTATSSTTDDADTLTSTAAVSVIATSSTTDAADTLTSQVNRSTAATASLTEDTDTLTSASVVSVIASSSTTDAADTLTSASVVSVVASSSTTDAADTLTGSATVGTVVWDANLSTTDVDDTLSSTAVVSVAATSSTTDEADALTSAVVTPRTVTSSTTDDADTLSSTVAMPRAATSSTTDDADTLTSTVARSTTASLSVTDDADTLSAQAANFEIRTASLSATDSADTLDSAGSVSVGATLAVTDGADTLSAAATLAASGSLSASDEADTLTGAATVTASGVASLSEGEDTLTATAAAQASASLAVADEADTSTSTGAVEVQVAASATDTDDTLTSIVLAVTLPGGLLDVTDQDDTLTATAFVSRLYNSITERSKSRVVTGTSSSATIKSNRTKVRVKR